MPDDLIGEAEFEIKDSFGAVTFESQILIGHWQQHGVSYRDELTRLFLDLPDTVANRRWIRAFRKKWKERLQQLELWVVSYRIEIE